MIYSNRQNTNCLIAEANERNVRALLKFFARQGMHADLADSFTRAVEFFDKNKYDIVFISEALQQSAGISGDKHLCFELLENIKVRRPQLPVVLILEDLQTYPQNLADTALRAVRSGFCDCLAAPVDEQKLQAILDSYLPNHPVETSACIEEGENSARIVGKSSGLLRTISLARRIAPTEAAVLISGESGTGKELIAHLIHRESKRASAPYIRVNCAALNESLLESELFGHEKGAFTGAIGMRKGRFEMADGGTLLLDEITETPIHFQSKLLRVLEQQSFERVGGSVNVSVDVRIISTSNKDLSAELSAGRLRRDLYYRLSALRLVVPPLRTRLEDLPDLVWHFVNLYSTQTNRCIKNLDPVMMEMLAKYDWPGNIRQLRNVIITSLVLGRGPTLAIADVSWLFDEVVNLSEVRDAGASGTVDRLESNLNSDAAGGVSLEQVERKAIIETLRQTAGNQSKAAKILGISGRTLRDKVRRYTSSSCLEPV